jgi:hypothetical protein
MFVVGNVGQFVFSFATSFILGTKLSPNTLGRAYPSQKLCQMILEYVEAKVYKIS